MTEEKKYLSIQDIENVDTTTYREIPAWGGLLRVASLSADEMIEYVEANEGPGQRVAGIRLLVRSLVDEDGVRIGKEEHIEIFKKKDTSTMTKVISEIMELNGIGRPKEVLDAIKNALSEAPIGVSPSTLH